MIIDPQRYVRFLIARAEQRRAEQDLQDREQYESIENHGVDCPCYFCSPSV